MREPPDLRESDRRRAAEAIRSPLRVGPRCMDMRLVPRDWNTLVTEINALDLASEHRAMESLGIETEDIVQLRVAPFPEAYWYAAFHAGVAFNADWWMPPPSEAP